MHALRHVHQLLAVDGALVDIHPVTEERVEAGERILGVIAEPDWISIDLPNSEESLRQTEREGLFVVEAETQYDVFQHFDVPDELIEAKRDLLEEQHELVHRIETATPPLVTRMHVVLRRLRALPIERSI